MKIIKLFLIFIIATIFISDTIIAANLKSESLNKAKVQAQSTEKIKLEAAMQSRIKARAALKYKLQEKERSGVTMSLKETSELAVLESDEIAKQMQSGLIEYAKNHKDKKPIVEEKDTTEIRLIEKMSSSKELPNDINSELNKFGLN